MNVTNGVTPRRWLYQCNPSLADLIAEKLGSKAFLKDLSLLANLKPLANDRDFQGRFMAVKHFNKVGLRWVRSVRIESVNLPARCPMDRFDSQIMFEASAASTYPPNFCLIAT